MSKPTALVIGSSRGIGKELSLQLSQNYQVYGTMRTSQEVEGNKFKVLTLDINDEKSVDEAAQKIEKLDLLIVNAAIGKDDKLLTTSPEYLTEYLASNVVGVHRCVLAFLPALRKGDEKKLIVISSTSGSCAFQMQKPFGFSGPYSVTKTALNMLAIQYHNELSEDGFTVLPIHPGWVKTDMGSSTAEKGEGAMPIPESVSGIVKVIDGATKEKSGTFYNWKGEVLEW